MNKECLITIGATAKFTELISAALSSECLQKFKDNGFTHLNVQYGDSKELFETLKLETGSDLDIKGFGFKRNGLHNEMSRCQAKEGILQQGLIICHAGKFMYEV
jgi:beta-1,4-N-acetylglucosaminyltransferase